MVTVRPCARGFAVGDRYKHRDCAGQSVAGSAFSNTIKCKPTGTRALSFRRNGNKDPPDLDARLWDSMCNLVRRSATVDGLDRSSSRSYAHFSHNSRRLWSRARPVCRSGFKRLCLIDFGRVITADCKTLSKRQTCRVQNVGVRFGALIDNLPTRFRIEFIPVAQLEYTGSRYTLVSNTRSGVFSESTRTPTPGGTPRVY